MYTIKIQRVGRLDLWFVDLCPGPPWSGQSPMCSAGKMKTECCKKVKIERKYLTKILLISLIEELGKCNNQFEGRLWGAVLRVEPKTIRLPLSYSLSCKGICVCVGVCVGMCGCVMSTCVHICSHAGGGQRKMSGVSLQHSSPHFLESGSPNDPAAHPLAKLPSQWTP